MDKAHVMMSKTKIAAGECRTYAASICRESLSESYMLLCRSPQSKRCVRQVSGRLSGSSAPQSHRPSVDHHRVPFNVTDKSCNELLSVLPPNKSQWSFRYGTSAAHYYPPRFVSPPVSSGVALHQRSLLPPWSVAALPHSPLVSRPTAVAAATFSTENDATSSSPTSSAETTAAAASSAEAEKESVTSLGMTDDGERMQFKAETQKLLQIVAHSLYKDKDVFVREQISNASDALEKLRFFQTCEIPSLLEPDTPLRIVLSADSTAKTFTIEDSGVGMSRDELIENLGTIAKSGSQAFLQETATRAKEEASAIIGQFGVGFYSSFVVADKVEVFTRSYDTAKDSRGWHWVSDGMGAFAIKECSDLKRGTKIVCHLKPNCLEFANSNNVKHIAQQFSSFISYPLYIKEGDVETALNTQEPLWLKPNATEEEHLQFFRYLSNASWGEPMYTLSYHTDAPLSIKSVFYVPEEAPSRLFQKKTEVKVSLHSRRVLVKKSAEDVVPKWLFFLHGVIDCEDMPLNVSRESMQDSRLIDRLSHTVVRRVLKFLQDEAHANPEKYKKFYLNYSYYLKEGLLDDIQNQGKFKENIVKLLRFQSSLKGATEELTLDEYIDGMKPSQQNIYYFCASDRQTALASPYMESFAKKKRNVLLMYEDIDEFVAMNLQNYRDKKLVAIDCPDEDFEPLLEGDEEELDANTDIGDSAGKGLVGTQQAEVEEYVKSVLGGKLTAVKFSTRLTNSPAIVTGFLSSTLRKMMKATLKGAGEAQLNMSSLPVTLELNSSHKIITYLYHLKNQNPDVAKLVVEQVYDNACVAAGILDDPRTMLDRLNNLLQITSQYAYHHHASVATSSAADGGEDTEGGGTHGTDSAPREDKQDVSADTPLGRATANGEEEGETKKQAPTAVQQSHEERGSKPMETHETASVKA